MQTGIKKEKLEKVAEYFDKRGYDFGARGVDAKSEEKAENNFGKSSAYHEAARYLRKKIGLKNKKAVMV